MEINSVGEFPNYNNLEFAVEAAALRITPKWDRVDAQSAA
jgi:hypothetical protein